MIKRILLNVNILIQHKNTINKFNKTFPHTIIILKNKNKCIASCSPREKIQNILYLFFGYNIVVYIHPSYIPPLSDLIIHQRFSHLVKKKNQNENKLVNQKCQKDKNRRK